MRIPSFRKMFRDAFDRMDRDFEQLDVQVAEMNERVEAAEAAAPAPGDNETVTTKTEETRPDGTRIVTTVTRTKLTKTVRSQ